MIKYYLYKSSKNIELSLLDEVIRFSFKEKFTIYPDAKNSGCIEASENLAQVIENIALLISNDLDIPMTFLISHENGEFSKNVLEHIYSNKSPRAYYLCDIILELSISGQNIFNFDLLNLFKEVDRDLLLTAEAFLLSGLNGSLAAKKLYIHRNTFSYRLGKFIEFTNLDIREYYNSQFFYIYLHIRNAFN